MIDVNEHLREQEDKRNRRDLLSINKALLKTVKDQSLKLDVYEKSKDIVLKPIKPLYNDSKGEATALALLSDIHPEEKITLVSTNGINQNSPEICKKRLQNYAVNLIKLINNHRNVVKVDHLLIGLLGDNVHGWIHEEYLSTNYMTPIEATLFIMEQLEAVLQFLLENGKFKRITAVCKIGNHSRVTDKCYTTTEAINSYEYIVYKYLEKKFAGQIEFLIEENYISYFDVYDNRISFEHGHAFKYAGGIGGIYPSLMRHLSKQYAVKKFDLACMGHWHSMIHLPNCLINGSVCGYNDYARRKGFAPEPPAQQLLLINKEKGFTTSEKIIL